MIAYSRWRHLVWRAAPACGRSGARTRRAGRLRRGWGAWPRRRSRCRSEVPSGSAPRRSGRPERGRASYRRRGRWGQGRPTTRPSETPGDRCTHRDSNTGGGVGGVKAEGRPVLGLTYFENVLLCPGMTNISISK